LNQDIITLLAEDDDEGEDSKEVGGYGNGQHHTYQHDRSSSEDNQDVGGSKWGDYQESEGYIEDV
jgi:hypothetical protein